MLVPFLDILRRIKKGRLTQKTNPDDLRASRIVAEWADKLPQTLKKTVGRPTVLSLGESSIVIGVGKDAALSDLYFYRAGLEDALGGGQRKGLRVTFRCRIDEGRG